MALANICFHWCNSESDFDSNVEDRLNEGIESIEDAYLKKRYREPIVFSVAIKGLLHVGAKFNRMKLLESQVTLWISRAASEDFLPKFDSFVSKARVELNKAIASESAGLQADVSEIDVYDFSN